MGPTLSQGNFTFSALLENTAVLTHPFVIGELACGNLKDRVQYLNSLQKLPRAQFVKDTEVLELVERKKLWGRGIGWIDMHLLASALVTGYTLWTLDHALKQAAIENGVAVTAHEFFE